MRFKLSKTTQAPLAATTTAFSTYLIGLRILAYGSWLLAVRQKACSYFISVWVAQCQLQQGLSLRTLSLDYIWMILGSSAKLWFSLGIALVSTT
jgi:hypothetical protein